MRRFLGSKILGFVPGWLALVLVLGGMAAAAPPVFHGNVWADASQNQSDPSFSGTVGPVVVAQATASPTIQPGYAGLYGAIYGPNPTANTTVTLNAATGENSSLALVVPQKTKVPNIQLQMNDGTATNLQQIGNIFFSNKGFTHSEEADIAVDSIGVTSGDLGGAIIFQTKKDDGSGLMQENMQLDHEGHVGCPGSCLSASTTSPASCAALSACSTLIFNFPRPFANSDTNAETPFCSAPGIQDMTTPTIIWTGNIKTVSSTAVTYQYAPTTATSAADTLTFTFNCYDSVY